jgi:polyisoprenoid-binding protein YceI
MPTSVRVLLPFATVLGLLAAVVPDARAQVHWTADKKASLAWWQINPHMNHLWATTCPSEPSWRPGEGRSGGWAISQIFRQPKQGEAAVSDTTEVPLYPRRRVRSLCAEAVDVRLTTADTLKWTGVQGEVTVKGDALIGGLDIRDEYTRKKLLQTYQYPEIKFAIDSLVGVTQRRDTMHAIAVGVFTLRGVSQPARATLRYWRELGGMRVLGRIKLRAHDLVPVYGMSYTNLGMGVGSYIWIDLYVGVDLLLRQTDHAASSSN